MDFSSGNWADVWLNGHYLGYHEGIMSPFQFDVTGFVDFDEIPGFHNLLAVKLNPPPKNQQNFAGKRPNNIGDYLIDVIPFGILRPVQLIATEDLIIDRYRIESSIEDNNAVAEFEIDITGFNWI